MSVLPILTTSLIHFSLKGWENVLFELGSERVNVFSFVRHLSGPVNLSRDFSRFSRGGAKSLWSNSLGVGWK